MNRRNLLFPGILAALAFAVPMTPAVGQQQPDLSRKAVIDDPVAPKRAGTAYDVTVVEFFDYNCPYCRVMVADIHQLISKDPQLRVVLREWPVFGAGSLYSARASLASLRQGKFWRFHTGLMGIEGPADDKSALPVAEAAGLDMDRLRKDMDDIVIARQIEHSWILAENMGLAGTPTFIAGDFGAFGRQSLDELRAMIAQVRRSS